jgi:hypothetical protein
MKSRKERVYIQDWLKFKPYNSQVGTDLYYLKVCNFIRDELSDFGFSVTLNPEEVTDLACVITSYFEDVISETNIWNSFIKVNKRLYHKPLPFYDVSEYFEKEINIQDISFLIWYFLNSIQEENFISPYGPLTLDSAVLIMDILEEEWEIAPENQHLKEYYSLPNEETDYYKARYLIDNILFNSYLFYFDLKTELEEAEQALIDDYKSGTEIKEQEVLSYLRENRDYMLHSLHSRLLALKGKEWAAEVVGEAHPLYKAFLTISKRIRGYFFYKGQDEEYIYLEHIASAKKFSLTKKSFDHGDTLKEIDTVMFMGIVKWMDEWWFSGIHFIADYNADLILDEKNSAKSRAEVSFLDHKSEKAVEVIEMQYQAFLKYNNNSPIAFLEGRKINEFIENYLQLFNNSLNLSEKERKESLKRARAEGFFAESQNSSLNFGEEVESGLLFFNQKSGLEIVNGLNSAFPDPQNPFFNENESEEQLMGLLVSDTVSGDLAKFCIDHYREVLSFFNNEEEAFILENIDFLLRFWKNGSYYSEIELTFTGSNERSD